MPNREGVAGERVNIGEEQRFFICRDGRITPDPTYLLGLEKTGLFICRDVALDDSTAANIALNCRLKTI